MVGGAVVCLMVCIVTCTMTEEEHGAVVSARISIIRLPTMRSDTKYQIGYAIDSSPEQMMESVSLCNSY